MAILGHLQASHRSDDRRVAMRRRLTLETEGVVRSASSTVLIFDISETGMLLQSSEDLQIGEDLEVSLPEAGRITAAVVWQSGSFFGCQFEKRIPRAWMSAAVLRSPVPSGESVTFANHGPGEAESPSDPHSDQFGLGQKLWAIIGLALFAWATVAALVWVTI